jgi:hypothetical protein
MISAENLDDMSSKPFGRGRFAQANRAENADAEYHVRAFCGYLQVDY